MNKKSHARNAIAAASLSLLLVISAAPPALAQNEFITGLQFADTIGTASGLSQLTFNQVLFAIADFLVGLIAAVALVAIIWGGVSYTASLGDEARVARAKRVVLFSVIGIAISGLAAFIISIVRTVLQIPLPGGGAPPTVAFQVAKIMGFILAFARVLLAPAGAIAFIALIYGGYAYITSGGDESRSARGKRAIVYGLVGLVVIGLAGIVVNTVINLLP